MEFEEREIQINDVKWRRLKGVRYPFKNNYYKLIDKINSGDPDWAPHKAFRSLFRNDLWALLYFVMRVESANHPFVVQFCRELQEADERGDDDRFIHLCAREHYKTTLITNARNVWKILNSHGEGARFPEKRIAIFSYAKTPAIKLLRPIKLLFEQSDILKACFPDIFYLNPEGESPKWGEDSLILKRKGFYKEATIEAHGLIEGMPTGSHFTDRTYDDIETEDLVQTPEMMEKVKKAIDVSQYLGVDGGKHEFVGTPYHWNGPLQYMMQKKYEDGTPVYRVNRRPGVGPDGVPVLMSQERIDFWKTDRRSFNAQCMLDPTPATERPLRSDLLKFVKRGELPNKLYKFMLVDPAGTDAKKHDGRPADAWAMGVIGVEPHLAAEGACNAYLLDARIRPMSEAEALDNIVAMYCRNGRIARLGIEKVAMTSAETHIANALRMKGRFVTVENGGIQIVRPGGRSKAQRIERALQWPLENGKLHVVEDIDAEAIERLMTEMEKFPYWHDDGLDMWSYLYDLLADYTFHGYRAAGPDGNSREDRYARALRKSKQRQVSRHSWLEV